MVDQLDPSWISEVGVGFRASKALLSAVDLDLFTELAREWRRRQPRGRATRTAGCHI